MKGRSEEEQKEQLEIILRLNKLTKREKLTWRRQPFQEHRRSGNRVGYVADWNGYRLIVEEAPRGSGGILASQRIGNASHRLRIRSRGAKRDDKIVIPPMPAIDDLVASIRRVNDEPDRAKGGIDDLRAFKRQLDEEL
jgi:hypothetical protein